MPVARGSLTPPRHSVLFALAAAAACNSSSPSSAPPPAPPAVATAPQPGDAAPRAPADADAIAAVRVWTRAIGEKKTDALDAASAFPFHLTNQLAPSCGDVVADEAGELREVAACLAADDVARGCLSATDPTLAVTAEPPEPPAMMGTTAWSELLPADRRSGHVFVELSGSDPKYPAHVLYALFAVRTASGAARVDAAFLFFSLEGD